MTLHFMVMEALDWLFFTPIWIWANFKCPFLMPILFGTELTAKQKEWIPILYLSMAGSVIEGYAVAPLTAG